MRERQGNLTQALRWIRKGHDALDGIDSEEGRSVRAQLTVWRAAIRAEQGRLREALNWAERGIEEASVANDKRALARAYLIRDYAELGTGQSEGPVWSRKALEIYEELEDLAGIGIASLNLGGYAYFAGEWDEDFLVVRPGQTIQASHDDGVVRVAE